MLNTILFILLVIYVVWSMLEFRSLQEVINELKDDIKLINKKNSELGDSIEKMENDIYSDDEFENVREMFKFSSGMSIPHVVKRKKTKFKKEIELIHNYLKVEKKQEPAKESKTLLVKKK